jgi:hypothetical protein
MKFFMFAKFQNVGVLVHNLPFLNCSLQCCGSGSLGSVRFWASRVRIRHYLYGSGSFHHQAKQQKVMKTLISTLLCHLYDFLSLNTDTGSHNHSHFCQNNTVTLIDMQTFQFGKCAAVGQSAFVSTSLTFIWLAWGMSLSRTPNSLSKITPV